MELLGVYKNGNFITKIFSNGTKIRETEEEEFIPAFAENMDIKITNYCNAGCPFCHEGSTMRGLHGDILNQKFIETLHPYQEVAIGGGDATSHPDLIPFLQKLKEKKVIANITVSQIHFEQKQELIRKLVGEKLVYGIGVSLVNPTDDFISLVQQYPNAVIHVINGVVWQEEMERLYDKDLKILILGYKELRRGSDWIRKERSWIAANQTWMKENLGEIINRFKVMSFDNLAIEQLEVRKIMRQEEWEEFYMGDDGTMTYFIDMVEKKFAKSSTAAFDKRYDLLDSVDDMFQRILSEKQLKIHFKDEKRC